MYTYIWGLNLVYWRRCIHICIHSAYFFLGICSPQHIHTKILTVICRRVQLCGHFGWRRCVCIYTWRLFFSPYIWPPKLSYKNPHDNLPTCATLWPLWLTRVHIHIYIHIYGAYFFGVYVAPNTSIQKSPQELADVCNFVATLADAGVCVHIYMAPIFFGVYLATNTFIQESPQWFSDVCNFVADAGMYLHDACIW